MSTHLARPVPWIGPYHRHLRIRVIRVIRWLRAYLLRRKVPPVRLNVTIDDKLERRFREVIGEVYGYKKGVLQHAIEQAVREWMEKYESESRKKRNK